MSLDSHERRATSAEMQANLRLAGLSSAEVAERLGLSTARAVAAIEVEGARPEDTWLVRDYLDRAVRAAGKSPTPWSVLTEEARGAARIWFPLVDVDDALSRTGHTT